MKKRKKPYTDSKAISFLVELVSFVLLLLRSGDGNVVV